MEIKTVYLALFMLITASCESDVKYVFTEGVRAHLKEVVINDLSSTFSLYDSIYGDNKHAVIDVCNECDSVVTDTRNGSVQGITTNDTIKLNVGDESGIERNLLFLKSVALHERGHLIKGSRKLNQELDLGGVNIYYVSGFTLKESLTDAGGYTLIEEAAVEYLSWHDGLIDNKRSVHARKFIGYYGMSILFQILEDRNKILSKAELYKAREDHNLQYIVKVFSDRNDGDKLNSVTDIYETLSLAMYVGNMLMDNEKDFGEVIESNGRLELLIQKNLQHLMLKEGINITEEELFSVYMETVCYYIGKILIDYLNGKKLDHEDLGVLVRIKLEKFNEKLNFDQPIEMELPFIR